jgi:hypothetical protein
MKLGDPERNKWGHSKNQRGRSLSGVGMGRHPKLLVMAE